MKFDLPCTHDTVEDLGNSALCAVSRSGQYLLLGIMIHLCTLTVSIHRALVKSTSHEANTAVNMLTTLVPVVFMAVGYSLDTDDEFVENGNLNAVRHAFTCNMRFSNMKEEWLVFWVPLLLSGVATAVFAVLGWAMMGDIARTLGITRAGASQPKSEGLRKLEAQRRRLIRIAAMVSACLLLNVGTALHVTTQQNAWTEYESKMLDCLTNAVGSRNYRDYGSLAQWILTRKQCIEVKTTQKCNKEMQKEISIF